MTLTASCGSLYDKDMQSSRIASCLLLCLLLGAVTSKAQSVDALIAAYSGKAEWNQAEQTLRFKTSGSINFAPAGVRSFIWNIPPSVKMVRIGKQVTVNGAFHTRTSVCIAGEDRKSSVVYGTDERFWPQRHQVMPFRVCTFQNFGGVMTVSNLTSLNPRGFHVRGWDQVVHVAYCNFIDNRGGWGNHSDGFEGGNGSTVDHCYFASGDDIIKVYFNVTVNDTTIKMIQNTVPIQLGWGDYSDGAVGTFHNLTVLGDGGRRNQGNAVISGHQGHYTVTLNIDGCRIENPNGTLVNLRKNTMTLRGSITNAIIRLKRYSSGHQAGTNLLMICGSTAQRANYDCDNVDFGRSVPGKD